MLGVNHPRGLHDSYSQVDILLAIYTQKKAKLFESFRAKQANKAFDALGYKAKRVSCSVSRMYIFCRAFEVS